MLRRWLCQADLTLRLTPLDPVLIKSGYATVDGPDMVPVQTYKDGKSVYYFPGTSLKGVLRSRIERIARTLRPGSVCIPYYEGDKQRERIPVESEKRSYRLRPPPEEGREFGPGLCPLVRGVPHVRLAGVRWPVHHQRCLSPGRLTSKA